METYEETTSISNNNYLMDLEFEDDISSEINELHDYYLKCIDIIKRIDKLDEIFIKDMVDKGELVIPKKPKKDLSDILKCVKRKKTVKNIDEVHSFLVKLLLTKNTNCDVVFPNVSDMTNIYQFLSTYNLTIKKNKAYTFYIKIKYGYYLDAYFNNYKDKNIPWKKHIKSCFNITDSYGRKLRSIGVLAHKFPKFQKLSITIEDFWKIYTDVKRMLDCEDYASFWSEK